MPEVQEKEQCVASPTEGDVSHKDPLTPSQETTPRQIKDRFFRSMLADVRISRAIIEGYLPPKLSRRCRWDTLKPQPTQAYTELFKEQIVDALLSMKLVGEQCSVLSLPNLHAHCKIPILFIKNN